MSGSSPPPPTFTISGTISPASAGAGSTVTLGGTTSATAIADAAGNYQFADLPDGSYTVTPSGPSLSFSPASHPVSVAGAHVGSMNFTATPLSGPPPPPPPSFTISGTISPASAGAGSTVTLGGATSATAIADAAGNYRFPGLLDGGYTVTPSGPSLNFSPAGRPVSVAGADVSSVNFTATPSSSPPPPPPPTFTISGTISPASAGLAVMLGGAASATATADAAGKYQFADLPDGNYTVTPSGPSLSFSPASRQISVAGANMSNVNFTATLPSPPPPPTFTISGTISPASAGSTVTLGGATNATTIADAAGNYRFAGLLNGGYTVTPSGPSLSFSPVSRQVNVASADVSSVNFTATPLSSPPPPPPPTFTISGTISPPSAGLAVMLGGAASATATVDTTTGKYQFAGLTNGNYTVTPSGQSLSFSPASRQISVTTADVGSVDFTATPSSPPPPPTFTISGTISPTLAGAGSTVTLSGTASATAIADPAGNYQFAGLLNGGYTVTPSGSSLSFSPASRPVNVADAPVSGVDFTATPSSPPPPPPTFTISGTISPPSAGLAVMLGGAASATATVDTTTGKYQFAGLLEGSYTVTPSGPSLSFSPASRQISVTTADVSSVNFTATLPPPPPPPTFKISGTITPTLAGAGSTVTLSGTASATAIADPAGNYQFAGLLNGGYTVTPSGPSLSFSPASRPVSLAGAPVSGVDFTATPSSPPPPPPTFTISGTISPPSAGLAVMLGGAASATATVDTTTGKYQFAGLLEGSYTVTPSGPSLSFSPASRQISVTTADVSSVNFTATLPPPPPPPTFKISGTITPTLAGAGSTVTLSGTASATAIADPAGNYQFAGLLNGGYTVTPSGPSLSFSPASRPVSVANANVSSVNFTATPLPSVIFFDDFAGTSLGPAWKVIERRGPASQAENACNTAGAVGVSGGILTITTSATPATCGDATPLPPTQLPYTTGDIQWTSLNFTYGTVEVRAKFPPQNTGTWPAIWLLGANCQAANPLNGSEDLAFNGCPEQGNPAYQEIDMVECDARGWCHIVVAQGSGGWSSMCTFQVDANFHVFTLTWNASIVSIAVDGNSTGCSYPNTSLDGPMFLIMQTQTTTSSGVAGLPNNANLPATFQIDYVKVTQP